MNNHGDDCYFYYYSTCTKGDTCPFRHCEAAMGNETVCNLWQEGRCFRTVCKFRHMEITKKRKEIPCYWENQLAGCQKPHCAFFHERPRYIDSIYFPPDKSLNKNEEKPQEEPAPMPAAPLPTAANPQLRGVKTEGQEPVPSPTHPPVVINPADDDEDEDDQFSEEGEDGKIGPSPRKLPKSDDSLNFGVSTLEEIRLRKALKASMKKANYPIQNAESTANGEKENIQSFFQPAIHRTRDGEKEDLLRMSAPQAFEESGRTRGSVSERLGKIMPSVKSGEGISLKMSLAKRLGRLVEDDESLMPPQKSLKSIKERLHLPGDPAVATPGAENSTGSKKTTEQIRIKTLEEIRQEKAAKSKSKSPTSVEKAAKSKSKSPTSVAPETSITKTIPSKNTKVIKRASASKDHFIGHIKTFSEVLHAKKKRQEDQQEQNASPPKKVRQTAEDVSNKLSDMPNNVKYDTEPTKAGQVRVKTLEEIRKEKAERLQAQQVKDAQNKTSETEENGTKRPRLFRVKKPVSHAGDVSEKISEVTEKPQKVPMAAPEPSSANSSSIVKVKSFEEIMREKRLRKQEMSEQASNSKTKDPVEVEPSTKPSVDGTGKSRAKVKLTPPVSSSSPPTSSGPVRKLITFKSKAASPPNSTAPPASPAATGLTSAPGKQSSSPRQPETHSQNLSSSSDILDNSTACPPDKPAKAAPQGPTVENPAVEKTLTGDNKVRPKLNVRPSVMKPAVQVKPGQKRRGAERSAVAAVKPLNSASAVVEDPPQETAFKDRQVFPSAGADIQLSSAVPQSPSTLLESSSSSSPVREELQTVPVFTQSPRQETKLVVSVPASREVCTVPQSPVQKTPTQSKSRRQSAAASRTASTTSTAASTSAVDDFEELMNEFTDDHMEGDMDPGIGEDDLLQELSDMIDS